ncbi:MAG: 3'-5'-exoribonuclease [Sclerophora amabilis]|nr:MAG: 3'-5'-exoribonuclease [Sclerophora amabilis]
MADRRRINAPSGGTSAPVFVTSATSADQSIPQRPSRTRPPNELRKTFLKTGLTPSASGSAYLELDRPPYPDGSGSGLPPSTSALKLTCTVHGPRPLPRSAAFTPNILLSTHIKFAPFAARQRRGYIRDATERDLAVHLETALRGVIIGDRWPKSGVEIIVTVLEGEEDRWWGDVGRRRPAELNGIGGCGMMSILAGCITVASAAIVDAGIDCVDLIAGGVAAAIPTRGQKEGERPSKSNSRMDQIENQLIIIDPAPSEHESITAACLVGYLPSRDEITELWVKENVSLPGIAPHTKATVPRALVDELIDRAVGAAIGTGVVLGDAVKEGAERKINRNGNKVQATRGTKITSDSADTVMSG